MGTSCIHCQTDLHSFFIEGVAIQLCMECKGVFLSERKLAIIEGKEEWHERRDALPRRRRSDKRDCPQCEHHMLKVRHGQVRPVFIDYCDACGGIWLDKDVLSFQPSIFEFLEFPDVDLRMRCA